MPKRKFRASNGIYLLNFQSSFIRNCGYPADGGVEKIIVATLLNFHQQKSRFLKAVLYRRTTEERRIIFPALRN